MKILLALVVLILIALALFAMWRVKHNFNAPGTRFLVVFPYLIGVSLSAHAIADLIGMIFEISVPYWIGSIVFFIFVLIPIINFKKKLDTKKLSL